MPGRRRSPRPDNLRATIADEAARLMADHGVGDFRAAKARAAERLGLGSQAPLPSNGEVEAALAARQRIFRADTQGPLLQRLRGAALDMMERLAEFEPRLVGPVLSGTATEHSTVDLHLFADTPEFVGERLAGLGLNARPVQLRHRWRRGEDHQLPGYEFHCDEVEYLATVFGQRQRGQPPLSAVDGRPMQRAGARAVAELLAGDGLSGR